MSGLRCCAGEQTLKLVAFDGKLFRFLSGEAYAPGQRLALTVELAPPFTLELKSLGSVKRADGSFEVRARALTLRREARAALAAIFTRA